MPRLRSLVALAALALTPACGGATNTDVGESSPGNAGGSGGSNGDSSPCDRLAQSYCARLEACDFARFHYSGGFSYFSFADQGRCRERFSLACSRLRAVPAAGIDDARIDACSAALDAVSCGNLSLSPDPRLPACDWGPGALDNNAPCRLDLQCQSQRCSTSKGQGCGACHPTVDDGQPCSTQIDCKPGATCWKNICTPLGSEGDPCASGSPPCSPGLSCSKTCQPPLALNPCGGSCDASQGLTCDATSKQCVPQPLSSLGESCGPVGGDLYKPPTLCQDQTGCLNQNDFGAGSCKPLLLEGEACDANAGPGCLFPASCLGGKCALLAADCG